VLHARDEVLMRGQADDPVNDANDANDANGANGANGASDASDVARIGARPPALENRRDTAHHSADGGAAVCLHHDLFADAWKRVALGVAARAASVEQEGLRAADGTQLDRDEPCGL
jgi:hypothetical protein